MSAAATNNTTRVDNYAGTYADNMTATLAANERMVRGEKEPAPDVIVEVYPDTYAGHMGAAAREAERAVLSDAATRNSDCGRQIVAAIFCGVFYCPCATTRLVRDYNGLNPMHMDCCGKTRKITGIEMCSAPDCTQIRGKDDRGYGHEEYHKPQDGGSGFSRRNLDCLTLFGCLVIPGVMVANAAG